MIHFLVMGSLLGFSAGVSPGPLLVGSKVGLAVIVGRSKFFLKGRVYVATMKCLGGVLCGLALLLFRE
jgi:hypothetical protein